MKSNQKGFGAVVPLLGLIVVTLIVFTGYYIYNNQKTNDKMSNKSSQSNKMPTAETPQTITFKEWGLKAPASTNLHLIYSLKDENNKFAEFTSTELLAADPMCNYGNGGGIIIQYSGTDMTEDGSRTIAQFAASSDGSNAGYKKVGDKYYYFAHTQAACSENTEARDLESRTNDAVKALVPQLDSL